MKFDHLSKKIIGNLLFSSGLGNLLINYQWKNRIDLVDEYIRHPDINIIGLYESGYQKDQIKSDKELFPETFPFYKLKNTGAPEYVYGDKYVFEIKNATLAGPFAIGFDKRGRVIRDMIAFKGGRFNTFLRSSLKITPVEMLSSLSGTRFVNQKSKNTIELDCVCVLHSAWNNYFHWIGEHIPKIQGMKLFESNTGIRPSVIIPPNPPSFVSETLEYFDFKENEIIEWKFKKIKVKRLIVPTFPEITIKTAEWLRNAFVKNLGMIEKQSTNKRLYISRSDAKGRRIINEKKVINFLKKFGFESITLSDLNFDEQVNLFSKAEAVIAPHGAGLTNILWGHNLKIIEIFGSETKQSFNYARIADSCNHSYDAIVVKSDEKNIEDLIVPMDVLENVLKRNGIK